MRTSLKLKLNRDRILNCGKYPLVFQIIHRRQRRLVYTEYQIFEESFDPEREKIISSKRYKFKRSELFRMNESLRLMRLEIESLIALITEKEKNFTVDSIISLYRRRKNNIYLLTFAEQVIEQLNRLAKFGTANNYRATINILSQYMKCDKLKFVDIDAKLLKDFEFFLQLRKLKQNSIAFYINNFRWALF